MSKLKKDNNTLLAGKTGMGLFLLSKGDNKRAFSIIEAVLNNLGVDPISGSFGVGLTGVLSALNLMVVHNLLDYEEVSPIFENTKVFLDKQCDNYIEAGNTEFLFGASGILQYYLSNKRVSAETINRQVDNLLNSKSEYSELGYEPNRHFPNINFGLAHGITGTGLMLTNALRDNRVSNRDRIYDTLDKIERYILSFIQEDEHILFPLKVSKEEVLRSEVLSWSYGDLGTILFLIECAHHRQDSISIKKYSKLLNRTLDRLNASYEVDENNLGIRHGMAGMIMILDRLCELVGKHDHLVEIRNKKNNQFFSMAKNRKLNEEIFERDLGAKTLANSMISGQFNLKSLFLL